LSAYLKSVQLVLSLLPIPLTIIWYLSAEYVGIIVQQGVDGFFRCEF
jgi:hypothetical protein